MFRFQEAIKIHKAYAITDTPSPFHVLERLDKLEMEHANDTIFNDHLESNSLIYVSLFTVIVIIVIISIIILHFKFSVIMPVLIAMRKFLLSDTRKAIKQHKSPTNV